MWDKRSAGHTDLNRERPVRRQPWRVMIFLLLVACIIFIPVIRITVTAAKQHGAAAVGATPAPPLGSASAKPTAIEHAAAAQNAGASDLSYTVTGIDYYMKTPQPKGSAPKAQSAAAAPKIPVLLYHSISDEPIGAKYLSVTVTDFELQMKTLLKRGFTPITLFEDPSRYQKPIIITFDDGYVDNYYNAYPVLKKYGIKATIFVISSFVNKPGYLSALQLKVMQDFVSFQSHTLDHQNLSKLDAAQIEYELSESKAQLSKITGQSVQALAYPNGGYSSQIGTIAAKYYSCALTTVNGFESKIGANYAIKRLYIVRSTTLNDFLSLLK